MNLAFPPERALFMEFAADILSSVHFRVVSLDVNAVGHTCTPSNRRCRIRECVVLDKSATPYAKAVQILLYGR